MMQECSYHYDEKIVNQHHLEGNVWSHTMMSYNQGLLNHVSEYVLWALLLHDLGRVFTRSENVEKSRVNFGDFEGVSCFAALDVLNETTLSSLQKNRVLKIISYQYVVIDHVKYDKPSINDLLETFKYEEEALKDLSNYVKCDLFGRIVDDDKLKYYNLTKANVFINDLLSLETKNKPVIKKNNVAYILVGPPCSRKSSWMEKQAGDFIIINRDDCVQEIGKKYGVHSYNEAYDLVYDDDKILEEVDSLYLKRKNFAKNSKNSNVVIDNPNLKIKNRQNWINAFKSTHEINVVVFLTSLKDLRACNKLRHEREDKSLSDKGLTNKLKTFEFPLLNEGMDEIQYVFNLD